MVIMDSRFSYDHEYSYTIDTPVYQGPLDILLQLIENAELDITTISLAQVTDQYLKHLKKLQDLPPDEISAFLVIAAKLIQIKSEALLPRQISSREEVIDIGNELARQLIAYKRYKEIADLLAERKDQGYQTYIRLSSRLLETNEQIDLGGFGINELFALAYRVFQKEIDRKSINTVVERPQITIRDKITQISERFRDTEELTFSDFLGPVYSRIDVVISFLALLELIKGNFVQVVQAELFDDIKMKKIKDELEMHEFALRKLEL